MMRATFPASQKCNFCQNAIEEGFDYLLFNGLVLDLTDERCRQGFWNKGCCCNDKMSL
jgi:hypothetical protein